MAGGWLRGHSCQQFLDDSDGAQGPLGGVVDGGRDAAAISLAFSNAAVTAGGNAFVFAFNGYGQDAFVVSMGGVHAGVSAGGDAGVFSIDYAIGSRSRRYCRESCSREMKKGGVSC